MIGPFRSARKAQNGPAVPGRSPGDGPPPGIRPRGTHLATGLAEKGPGETRPRGAVDWHSCTIFVTVVCSGTGRQTVEPARTILEERVAP